MEPVSYFSLSDVLLIFFNFMLRDSGEAGEMDSIEIANIAAVVLGIIERMNLSKPDKDPYDCVRNVGIVLSLNTSTRTAICMDTRKDSARSVNNDRIHTDHRVQLHLEKVHRDCSQVDSITRGERRAPTEKINTYLSYADSRERTEILSYDRFILAILEQVGWKSHPEETFTGWAWTRTPNISCANATNASKLQDHDSPRSSVMATNGQKKYHQP
ncbi:unnamed protein product [Hymenolepis diminuta]|uniref:C2 domain-containing protein n=1 Tax=Hymenolepis diminuta TaxID=6216 RepID=A0A0R3SA31_HYMDI|nr:unnamed protein product [Hymenolepis diminuta]